MAAESGKKLFVGPRFRRIRQQLGLSQTQIAELEARKAAAEQQLARLVDHPHIDPALLAQSIAGFAERIAERRRAIATSSRARLLLEHAGLDEQAWEGLPLGTRRALVRATYTVTVWPVRRKGPGFEAETIELTPVG